MTQRYMLTATVRVAALHRSARKRQLQSAAQAHVGVKCPHADVTADGPQKGQPACTDVSLRAVRGFPAGDVYLFAGLHCI